MDRIKMRDTPVNAIRRIRSIRGTTQPTAQLQTGPFARWMQERLAFAFEHTPEYLGAQWRKKSIDITDAQITAMRDGALVPDREQLGAIADKLNMPLPKRISFFRAASEQAELIASASGQSAQKGRSH